jgi:hypothetical protein
VLERARPGLEPISYGFGIRRHGRKYCTTGERCRGERLAEMIPTAPGPEFKNSTWTQIPNHPFRRAETGCTSFSVAEICVCVLVVLKGM